MNTSTPVKIFQIDSMAIGRIMIDSDGDSIGDLMENNTSRKWRLLFVLQVAGL